jgi:ABC-type transporter Mla maintaining outer membrane lipid asymmetry ATPase subunit MlaF
MIDPGIHPTLCAALQQIDEDIVLETSGNWKRGGATVTVTGRASNHSTTHDQLGKLCSNDPTLQAPILSQIRSVTGTAGGKYISVSGPDELPESLPDLLSLALVVPEHNDNQATPHDASKIHKLGKVPRKGWEEFRTLLVFTGKTVLLLARFSRRMARLRPADFSIVPQQYVIQALLIVPLIIFLFGSILAFLENVQLTNFGAAQFVADLLGAAMVREMEVVMPLVITDAFGRRKSSLLRRVIGLQERAKGSTLYDGKALTAPGPTERGSSSRRFRVMYQSGSLRSSLPLGENASMPIAQRAKLPPKNMRDLGCYKLSLVVLSGDEDYLLSQISDGIEKTAGIARAVALNRNVHFLDAPIGGLDPLISRRLGDLILRLRNCQDSAIVTDTHEFATIFMITGQALFRETANHTLGAFKNPDEFRDQADHFAVRIFLNRWELAPSTS